MILNAIILILLVCGFLQDLEQALSNNLSYY